MAKMWRRKRVTTAYHRCSDGVYRTHYMIGCRNYEAGQTLSATAHPHEAEGYVASARRKFDLRLLDGVGLVNAERAALENRAYHRGVRAVSDTDLMRAEQVRLERLAAIQTDIASYAWAQRRAARRELGPE